MATIYVLEAANLFAGSHDPEASNHLVLNNLKLPALEENNADWISTGAPIATEVDTHVNRLEAPFILHGWQPWVLQLLGERDRTRNIYTAYGLVRDRRTGEALEAKAIMEGRLGRVDPTAFERGTVQNHEYTIRAITHYELYLQNEELMFWDYFTSVRRMRGRDLNADLNRILRIPAAA